VALVGAGTWPYISRLSPIYGPHFRNQNAKLAHFNGLVLAHCMGLHFSVMLAFNFTHCKNVLCLGQTLGSRKKKRVLCAARQFSSCCCYCCFAFRFSSSCSCVHLPLFLFFSLFFFWFFFGRVKVKNGNKYTKRKMQQYRCKFYMHTSHLCRECVEICYFKCWRPKGARLDGFCGGILGDHGVLGAAWVTG